jgi:hypothetical protein
MGSEEMTSTEQRPAPGGLVVDVIGFALYAAVGYIVLVGGLIMPLWAVAVLGLIWFAGLYLAIRWRRQRNRFLALPFIMFAIWLATAYLGETFLGWTA